MFCQKCGKSPSYVGDNPCHLRTPPKNHALLHAPGQIIDDRFLVVDLLYNSETVQVVKAFDQAEIQMVIIKFALSESAIEELKCEAFYLSKLLPVKIQVPKIICLSLSAVESKLGGKTSSYIALSPVGTSVAQLEVLARESGHSLSETCRIKWKEQLSHILKQIHQANILHRDIKPSNLIISENQLFLIDFADATSLSNPSTYKAGTLPYMSLAALQNKPATVKDDWISLEYTMMALEMGIHTFEKLTKRPELGISPKCSKQFSNQE